MTVKKQILDSLRLFAQTAKIMNRTLNRGELVDILLDESSKLVSCKSAVLVIKNTELDVCEAYLTYDRRKRHQQLSVEEMKDQCTSLEQPSYQAVAGDDYWRLRIAEEFGADFSSRLRVPLSNRGEAIGLLDLYDCDSATDEFEYSIELINAMTDLFVIAWDNAEMYDAMRRKSLQNDLLLESARLLSTSLELDEVLRNMTVALKNVVDYDAIGIYLTKRDTSIVTPRVWKGYPGEDSHTRLGLKVGEGLVGWVIETGEAIYVPDTKENSRYIEARPETRSELVVPILADGRIIGAFNVESDAVDAYSKDDVQFLTVFASQAAVSIERARLYKETLMNRRLEEQLSIARMIQQTFLPNQNPTVAGFDIAGKNVPSQEVGGDYYDFIDIVENQTGIAIADVSGKGMPASLIMAAYRASLIAEIRNNYAIRTILQKVNRLLCESLNGGRFVTAVYAVLDTKNRILTFSNAGHNPPLIIRRDNSFQELREGGLALGILPESEYEERPVYIESGDIVVLHTDGVNEAVNASGQQFGEKRIIDTLIANRDRSAGELVHLLIDSVISFSSENEELDDITVIVIKAA
jgi:sigma-B regulation protein RsbU (phosphoserine phosphatase)